MECVAIEPHMARARARLLVIEDDPDQRRLLCELLRRESFDVTGCGTVEDALARADELEFAVAVVDLGLPGRDGIDFAKALARDNRKTRVIIHTGRGSFESAKEGLNLRVFAYVEKLGNLDVLIERVQRAATEYLTESLSRAEDEIRLQVRLLDAVEQGVVATNLAGEVIYWNRWAERLTGWRSADVLGRIALDLLIPRGFLELQSSISLRLQAGYTWDGEFQFHRDADVKTNEPSRTFPLRLAASPILGSTGELAGFIGTFSDISIEKAAEAELRAHAHRQAIGAQLGLLALSQMDIGVLMQRLGELVQEALHVDAVDVLRWSVSHQQLKVKAAAGYRHGAIESTIENELQSQAGYTFSTGHATVVEDVRSELRFGQSSIHVQEGIVSGVTVPIVGHQENYGVIGIYCRQRRAFTRAEVDFAKMVANLLATSLERHELISRWQSLFNNTHDAILLADSSGVYVDVNGAACSMLGYAQFELLGLTLGDLVAETERSEAAELWKQMQEKGRSAGELRLRSRSGQTICVQFRGVANVIPGVHLTDFRDITEQKQIEAVIQQQQRHLAHVQRVATLGQMAAVLAHEINQPLGAISNFSGGLALGLERSDIPRSDLIDTLNRINEEALRAGDIVRRLRRLNSPVVTEPALVDIIQVVHETLALLQGELTYRQATVRCHQDSGIPHVLGDAVQLQQVLVNLLKNAVEAMDGLPRDEKWVEISTRATTDEVVVTIRDNGLPVEPSILERLFQPYSSTKTEGLGMGLCISRTIIEQHQGEIVASPNPDRGMTFTLKLPASVA